MTTIDRITALVADHLSRTPADVGPDVPMSDLGADSLDRVEIVIAIEEAFDLLVVDDAFDAIHTVADLARYVDAALNTRAGETHGAQR